MALNCGIIGITNTGKTTLFNCISSTRAESSSYAFSSNRSNLGVVNVPDPRLYKLAELVKPPKTTPATVEIVDIPGLTRGSSQGEGIPWMSTCLSQFSVIMSARRVVSGPPPVITAAIARFAAWCKWSLRSEVLGLESHFNQLEA